MYNSRLIAYLIIGFLVLPLKAMELVSTVAVSGRAQDVRLQGNFAYCSDQYGLWVVDLSSPQQPVPFSNWGSLGFSVGLELDGSFGYLCDNQSGLLALDLTDPSQPLLVDVASGISSAFSACADGDYLYVAAGEDGLVVLDKTDPEALQKIGEYNPDDWILDLEVAAGLVALASDAQGVSILDVSSPASPVLISEINLPGSAGPVIFNGDYLIILRKETGISIWNISDPYQPVQVSAFTTGGWSTEMVLDGNTLLVGDWFEGVNIYDITDPVRPDVLNSFVPGGFIEGMDLQDNLLALALDDDGLEFWDISSITAPEYLGSERAEGSPQDVLFDAQGWVYEVAGDAGLRVWNENLQSEVPLAQLDTPGWANSLALSQNWLYLADGFGGVRIFDRSSSPQEAYVVPTSGYAGRLSINSSDVLFFSLGESGFSSLVMEWQVSPQVQNSTLTDDYVYDISASDNLLVTCEGTAGFEIFDVSNPDAPELLTLEQPAGGAWCACMQGNTAYVGTGLNGIAIYDLSQPESPLLVSTVGGVGWAQSLSPGGEGVLIACSGMDGIFSISVSQNPPQIIDSYDTPGTARRACISGEFLYCADEMDLSLYGMWLGVPSSGQPVPLTYDFFAPYPNPFNPSTNISFSLPVPTLVELAIYDLMGRRVSTLVNGRLPSGRHSFNWTPAVNVASGTYLINLEADGQSSVRSLVYLK